MSSTKISGITDLHIEKMRTKAVESGIKMSPDVDFTNEITKIKMIYEIIIKSTQFRDHLHERLETSNDDDPKFVKAIEQVEEEATTIVWMHYHPDVYRFVFSRKEGASIISGSASQAWLPEPTVLNLITKKVDSFSAAAMETELNTYVIGKDQPLERLLRVQDRWNSKSNSLKPAGNFYYSDDKQYDDTIRSIAEAALSDNRTDAYLRQRALKRLFDNRVFSSTIHQLSNGLPLFPFVFPQGMKRLEHISFKQALNLEWKFDWNDEKLFEVSNFRKEFLSLSFARPTANNDNNEEEEDQEDEEDDDSEEEESEDNDESEEDDSVKDESEPGTQPSSPPPEEADPANPTQPEEANPTTSKPEETDPISSTPDPPPPSPPPQEAEEDSSSESNRGTGRYNRRKRRERKNRKAEEEDDDPIDPNTKQSTTDQQGDKRSESPTSDQDDIDEHFLDDLHLRSKEYIDQFNNWDELPESQDHVKRFNIDDDVPQNVNAADVRDDDIVISLNDSSRSLQFVLTFVETTRKPVFNRILDPRRNRYS